MSDSYLGKFFGCLWALVLANLFCLRGLFRYQVCTQYKEARHEGEWDVIFIGVVQREVEAHPNFPKGRYVWLPCRTYWGEFNHELRRFG